MTNAAIATGNGFTLITCIGPDFKKFDAVQVGFWFT